MSFPTRRLRRLRRTPALRRLVAESRLTADDLIAPLFVREAIDEPQPISSLPGVVELLDQAEALGLAKAVASSSPISWVGRHLDRLGIIERFAAVRTQDDVHRTKPWPDVFLAAATALQVRPERAVVFEDSRNGVLAAKEAGMFCVAVPNRITEGMDFSDADLVVSSLADVDLAALMSA